MTNLEPLRNSQTVQRISLFTQGCAVPAIPQGKNFAVLKGQNYVINQAFGYTIRITRITPKKLAVFVTLSDSLCNHHYAVYSQCYCTQFTRFRTRNATGSQCAHASAFDAIVKMAMLLYAWETRETGSECSALSEASEGRSNW